MNSPRLFGTDGIRGTFGSWPLTRDIVTACGLAVGRSITADNNQAAVIIGMDTRASCPVIERWLTQGLRAAAVSVYRAGVVPTPGLAYLTTARQVAVGIMISASHNPAADNGIKLFNHQGFKLTEAEERRLEQDIAVLCRQPPVRPLPTAPRARRCATGSYIDNLIASAAGVSLSGMRVVLDCAHGATSDYAAAVITRLGGRPIVINNAPDGTNINAGCGSLHPEAMARTVSARRAAIGFSFDGDGDRVMVCDERGRVLDGDYMMLAAARHLRRQGRLRAPVVVGTSMSNFGLEQALTKAGMTLLRADVGDKYVLRDMQQHNAQFGGEQSGHIIFLDHATTGDGLLTAVQLLRMMVETGKPFSRLCAGLTKYPQVLRNVRVREKPDLSTIPAVAAAMRAATAALAGDGRVVVRYSGTEPLARVMIEGPRRRLIEQLTAAIIDAIDTAIGSRA